MKGLATRALNGVLMTLMVLFAIVQYNDPDGLLWMFIYAIPAVWTAMVVFYRPLLARPFIHGLLCLCILLSVAGLIYFWPATPGWWRQDVWWETETAREGMGMMVVTVTLIVVWLCRPPNSQI